MRSPVGQVSVANVVNLIPGLRISYSGSTDTSQTFSSGGEGAASQEEFTPANTFLLVGPLFLVLVIETLTFVQLSSPVLNLKKEKG